MQSRGARYTGSHRCARAGRIYIYTYYPIAYSPRERSVIGIRPSVRIFRAVLMGGWDKSLMLLHFSLGIIPVRVLEKNLFVVNK